MNTSRHFLKCLEGHMMTAISAGICNREKKNILQALQHAQMTTWHQVKKICHSVARIVSQLKKLRILSTMFFMFFPTDSRIDYG